MKAIVVLNMPDDYDFEKMSIVQVENEGYGISISGTIKPVKELSELCGLTEDVWNKYFEEAEKSMDMVLEEDEPDMETIDDWVDEPAEEVQKWLSYVTKKKVPTGESVQKVEMPKLASNTDTKTRKTLNLFQDIFSKYAYPDETQKVKPRW